MKNLTILLLICFSVVLFSCNNEKKEQKDNTLTLTIASKQVNCTGVMPQQCYLIKLDGQQGWSYFYDSIEGFSYTPGYEYTLEVKVDSIANPPADRSSLKYTLVKEISKVQKESADMP